ncbi:DUF2780 domain-containing protein [Hydrogenimonas sp.]
MKKTILTVLLGSALTLQAGFFDSLLSKPEPKSDKPAAQSAQNDLLSTLTGSLGITQKQAAGGTAALMQAASSKIPASNYNEILKSVPGLDSIVGENAGMLGGAMSMLGGGDTVSKAFKTLGMDDSMIGKFIPLILQYSGKYVSKENLSLLKTALGSVL